MDMDTLDQDRRQAAKMLVAVVDANDSHRRQVSQALMSFYEVAVFATSDDAVASLRNTQPRAILVDQSTSPLGGDAFIKQIRRDGLFGGAPVILTSASDENTTRAAAAQCGADTYLVKPYRRSTLIRTISHQLNRNVERKWTALPDLPRQALVNTMDVFNSFSDVVEKGEPLAYSKVMAACGPLVEAVGMKQFKDVLAGVRDHDNYSYAHSLGTSTLLLLFGYTIGLKEPDLSLIGAGGLLHDVGKMLIPYDVLNKSGRLSAEEFAVMKSHVPLTLKFLKNSSEFPKMVLTIAAEHHERLDGSGYPLGLKGTALNELSRMAAIVDVFCALSDRRPYREPLDAESALHLMTTEMTSTLDQKLLALFREMLLDSKS